MRFNKSCGNINLTNHVICDIIIIEKNEETTKMTNNVNTLIKIRTRMENQKRIAFENIKRAFKAFHDDERGVIGQEAIAAAHEKILQYYKENFPEKEKFNLIKKTFFDMGDAYYDGNVELFDASIEAALNLIYEVK